MALSSNATRILSATDLLPAGHILSFAGLCIMLLSLIDKREQLLTVVACGRVTMQGTLIQQGIDLMIFGMGTVFVFLIALVLVIVLMSRLINKFFAVAPDTTTTDAGNPNQVEPLIKKIIQSAIDQHRRH